MPGRHREGADEVGDAGVGRGHEVGEGDVGPAVGLGHLLAERPEDRPRLLTLVVAPDRDVVAVDAVGRPEADDRVRRQPPVADEPVEERQRVAVEVARRGPEPRVVEDRRVGAAHLPGREERRPVDEVDEFGERVVVERPRPEEGRAGRGHGGPVDRHVVGARLGDGQPLLLRPRSGSLAPDRLVLVADPGHERVAPVGLDECAGDADRPRGVDDVDDRPRVGRRDLDRGVGPRRRRAADEQRDGEALALHLGRHVGHLVERRRDEPRQPDQVGIDLDRLLEDPRGRDHHARGRRPRSRCSRARPRRCSCRCRGRRP